MGDKKYQLQSRTTADAEWENVLAPAALETLNTTIDIFVSFIRDVGADPSGRPIERMRLVEVLDESTGQLANEAIREFDPRTEDPSSEWVEAFNAEAEERGFDPAGGLQCPQPDSPE